MSQEEDALHEEKGYERYKYLDELYDLKMFQKSSKSVASTRGRSFSPTRSRRNKVHMKDRSCLHCGARDTPQWREGPKGEKTLCNACGIQYKKDRLHPEYRPASSPSFIPNVHSNSHKKIMKMKTTNIYDDVVQPTVTTPLKVPELSNVASCHVTSNILAQPSVDDISLQDTVLENLGTNKLAVLEGDSLPEDGTITTPKSSDTNVDPVTSSSQRNLRARPTHPSLKYNENEWITVATCRQSKHSRGRRESFN